MMRAFLLSLLLLLMTFTSDRAAPAPPPGPHAAQWKKIDALLAKDQTATAAPLVEALYRQAKAAGDSPNEVRALLYKIKLLERKENDASEKAIALLEADVKTAAFPVRPVLHSLLAELYTQYINQNRYRIYQRTAGANDSIAVPGEADGGTGLATWDLARLAAAIVRHYRQSVTEEPARQLQTSLAALGDLVRGGDAEGRALRPTLFDLLAQRAVAGLANQELYVTRPEQQFVLSDPKLFGTAAEFAGLKLVGPKADSLNGELLALQMLQQLTAARLKLAPKELAALADVDLQRVNYLRDLTNQTDLGAAYGPALARLAEAYAALPISTEFMTQRAIRLHDEGDAMAAVKLAREAQARFPKSRGAAAARALLAEIERAEINFSGVDIVVPGQPWPLTASVRNVTQLHAWAYRLTLREWERFNEYDPKQRPFAERHARVLNAAPVAVWAVPVVGAKADYKAVKLMAAGAALPVGHYVVVLSNQTKNPFAKQGNTATAYALLVASELSVLTRPEWKIGATRQLLLHRQTGVPLPGVRVQAEYWSYVPGTGNEVKRMGEVLTTDAAGEVLVPTDFPEGSREHLRLVRVWRGADTLLLNESGGYSDPAYNTEVAAVPQAFLFTDRAIYRPGQTLYFKGILTETRREKSTLLTGLPVSVRLLDVNGQTIQTLTFTTSDFGSFNGSLVLSTGLLNGEMYLETDQGRVSFAVEDYKRPTFAVTFEPLTGTPALGQPVALHGTATAYAGAAVDGAAVNYRVTRREIWPMYEFDFRGGYPGGREVQEIAHGRAETNAEGRFSVVFTPPKSPQNNKKSRWQPSYIFEVTADVTDAAGETRTGVQTVNIGTETLALRLAGPALVDKNKGAAFQIFSTNAAGEPLPATGTVQVLARSYKPNPPGIPGPVDESEANEARPQLLQTINFDSKAGMAALPDLLAALPAGRYLLEGRATGQDSAQARLPFVLYDSESTALPYATPDWVVALADTVRPGQPATLLIGSQHEGARVLLEVEREGKLLRHEWLTLKGGEQRKISIASGPMEALGPLYIHTTQVWANKLYQHTNPVAVAEPPQPLRLAISTFRDKLQPGERETWRITIRQADGKPAEAELLATLYDQSLDAFRPHGFQELASGRGYYPVRFGWQGLFGQVNAEELFGREYVPVPGVSYPMLLTWQMVGEDGRFGYGGGRTMLGMRRGKAKQESQMDEVVVMAGAAMAAPMADRAAGASNIRSQKQGEPDAAPASPPAPKPVGPDLGAIQARSDFRETAFWQPAMRTDKNGEVVLEFQMPEAVTRWQLLALAHDKQLHSGQLARQLLTQKQVQITPHVPRFFRQGDTFTLTAKLANLTEKSVQGTAQLWLLDAATGADLTSQLVQGPAQQAVSAAGKQSAALAWEVRLPADFAPTAITYKVVAQAGEPENAKAGKAKPNKKQAASNKQPPTFSDGEQNTLPVLPNRMLVTESLPLPIVGPATRVFELTKLTSTSSPTRTNQSLTLEMTANPAWYAVQSLPYLMEYPYECSEQVFSRLYANLLAAHILKSNPRFKAVLAEWQRQTREGSAAQKQALASKLEQNQELKALLLQETPWVRDAQDENERLVRLSTLFDEVRLKGETERALLKLQKMQLGSGAFPWFEQMPDDRYITQLIVAGFGKLKQLGAFDAGQDATAQPILQNALRYLDTSLARDHTELRRQKGVKLGDDHLGDLQIQALYARSFWLQPGPANNAAGAKAAEAYYKEQAAKFWPRQSRYLQAQLALALHRHDAKSPAAAEILRGLRENALHSPELGMYWKEVTGGYYWREAPTETQATLIEAFHEVANDQRAVDEMKLWLLKQKQTQHWESTRATADACYALLLRGSDWLTPGPPLQITVGGQPIKPEATQAGTGYFKTTWPAAAVKPVQGQVSITKPDAGVAWGALYWQYFEDIDKLTPAATPLSLERQLYRETRTAAGPQLEKLTTAPLKVGETLVVRLVLRTDRALEYVHLKDQRAAGLEPISQTSGYRYQNGLGYYESPRDAATNFFLGAVPRGTHVFEYRLRASQAGNFSGGLSQVQCLYAPEFGAHSAGGRLLIQ